jgi:hypothetical protein
MFHFNRQFVAIQTCIISIFIVPADAKNHAGPYRAASEEIQNFHEDLSAYDEADFAKMSLDDIRLKVAYHQLFLSSISGKFQNKQPEIIAALADVRKRSNSATPMLLKLMDENQETGFESSILASIAEVGTINIEPYLEYARKVLRERTETMNGVLVACAAQLIADHGTKQDAELLKWVMETRPYVADAITRKLDELNRRLGLPKPTPGLLLRNTSTTAGEVNGASTLEPRKPSLAAPDKSRGTDWNPLWGFWSFLTMGLLWLMVRNWKKSK